MMQQSQLRTDPLVVLLLLLAAGLSYFHFKEGAVTGGEVPALARQAKPIVPQTAGRLVFAEKFFDFSTVVEGDIIKHSFKFKNEGSGPVKIIKTEASCGCTTLNGVVREYAPGEVAEIVAEIDTKGKKGIVVKTVTLILENNDVATVEISMAMKLEPPPHPKMEKMRNINAEAACKTCHLESGVGESGVFLYHRVCAQCHGKKGVGGFGQALNDPKWQKVGEAYIKKVIHAGLPDNGMPSFVEGVTSPLTDDQVSSLIQYIRKIAKQ